jgi:multidrug efflux pump subunit AcrA (membrane-fusion protein)
VTLILGEQNDVILVPSEAVHREISRSIVYVLHREKQGKERVEIRAVAPGVDDGIHAEMRSGLKPGEEVVLAGLPRLGVQAADAQGGGPGRR